MPMEVFLWIPSHCFPCPQTKPPNPRQINRSIYCLSQHWPSHSCKSSAESRKTRGDLWWGKPRTGWRGKPAERQTTISRLRQLLYKNCSLSTVVQWLGSPKLKYKTLAYCRMILYSKSQDENFYVWVFCEKCMFEACSLLFHIRVSAPPQAADPTVLRLTTKEIWQKKL